MSSYVHCTLHIFIIRRGLKWSPVRQHVWGGKHAWWSAAAQRNRATQVRCGPYSLSFRLLASLAAGYVTSQAALCVLNLPCSASSMPHLPGGNLRPKPTLICMCTCTLCACSSASSMHHLPSGKMCLHCALIVCMHALYACSSASGTSHCPEESSGPGQACEAPSLISLSPDEALLEERKNPTQHASPSLPGTEAAAARLPHRHCLSCPGHSPGAQLSTQHASMLLVWAMFQA
eukprot:1152238-Pelagomonas_calceolata.AAC.3